MSHFQQVQRAINYIEDHLHDDLSIDSIVRVAGISKWYFQSIFGAVIGDTVKEYIRKRRLTLAAIEIASDRRSILDIALDAGFKTQESFTRTFKSFFSITPGECRKNGTKSIMIFSKPKITTKYLDHLSGGITMKPKIQSFEEKTMIGLRERFISALSPDTNNFQIIPKLWQKYLSRRNEIQSQCGNVNMGVVIPHIEGKKSHPDEMLYIACTEVTNTKSIPKGMTVIEIPAGKYAVFTHRGPVETIGHTMNYVYGSWMAKSKEKLRNAPHLEIYDDRFKPASEDSEIDVCVPIE